MDFPRDVADSLIFLFRRRSILQRLAPPGHHFFAFGATGHRFKHLPFNVDGGAYQDRRQRDIRSSCLGSGAKRGDRVDTGNSPAW